MRDKEEIILKIIDRLNYFHDHICYKYKNNDIYSFGYDIELLITLNILFWFFYDTESQALISKLMLEVNKANNACIYGLIHISDSPFLLKSNTDFIWITDKINKLRDNLEKLKGI